MSATRCERDIEGSHATERLRGGRVWVFFFSILWIVYSNKPLCVKKKRDEKNSACVGVRADSSQFPIPHSVTKNSLTYIKKINHMAFFSLPLPAPLEQGGKQPHKSPAKRIFLMQSLHQRSAAPLELRRGALPIKEKSIHYAICRLEMGDVWGGVTEKKRVLITCSIPRTTDFP